MKTREKILGGVVAVALAMTTGCSAAPESPDTSAEKPKNIFYFIGDGMGASHRQLAEGYTQWKKDGFA